MNCSFLKARNDRFFCQSIQKAAYDTTLKAKERARLRVQAYDSKRKKFKEGL